MPYSIDTSIVITAWRDHYWPHIFTGFWERFNDAVEDGTFVAVQPVKDELVRKDDEIGKWAKAANGFFVPLEEDVQAAAIDVLATHPGLITQGGKRSTVDPFVIALGIARGIPVVSYERRSPNPEKPHIPNVCDDKHHPFMSIRELMTELGWNFPADALGR
ncbi:DUF4411 family protein [Curtobacterium sp. ODYSSEY 48 V2]|uniref:DUF4411 family protein n=1 Tax=Curtobacterium sp. ODYSSEY 48 V2 TaxID=2939561 RepID=UPI00203FD6F6|nr:DUF4411 family protein [Curtobacterium sp. ODYSSEY 48 V2]MCM3506495.1 DUF4411 family protein [Curtobacterium sp. ODYSSEY 48 V2]